MKHAVAYAVLFVLAVFGCAMSSAHADPQPALDRQLVERMTRALEEQARATQQLARVMERCR